MQTAQNNKKQLMAGAAGIALNVLLAAAKVTVGLLTGLVSVVADGLNNVGDCGSGVISIVSIRFADKPADREHPFGHRRAEYIAAMIIAFIVLVMAAELFRDSLGKILYGGLSQANAAVYAVLGASVAVKAGMAVFYFVAAKKSSDTLRAAGIDSLCDCASTIAVITGAALSDILKVPADGWAGIIVALFILWQGFALLKDTSSKLLGRAPDQSLVDDIKNYLLSGRNVLGVHDLKLYPYGRGVYFATAHVEMDCSLPAIEAHSIIDGLERGVKEKFNVALTAHLDPVDLSDEEAHMLEERVRAVVSGIGEGIGVHDFRLVRGAEKKLVFDVTAPYSCTLSDAEILTNIQYDLAFLNFRLVITIDRF